MGKKIGPAESGTYVVQIIGTPSSPVGPFYAFSSSKEFSLAKADYYIIKEADNLLQLGHDASTLAKIFGRLASYFP